MLRVGERSRGDDVGDAASYLVLNELTWEGTPNLILLELSITALIMLSDGTSVDDSEEAKIGSRRVYILGTSTSQPKLEPQPFNLNH